MIPEDHVWLNPLIHERWLFMAGKIERQPELLEIPLKNIARWIAMDRLGDVRPLIRGRIAPKHIGSLYRRARSEGLLVDTGQLEPSTDAAGRNTDKQSRIYRVAA